MDNQVTGQAKVVEHPVRAAEGFDIRVHIRDEKTGALVRTQHYAKHANGKDIIFEQPIGSGNMFSQSGAPIGNYTIDNKGAWQKKSSEHVAVAETKAISFNELAEKNAALEAELVALKAEQTAKVAKPQADKLK